jgi:nitrite reductase/ring-hydroxylating ferredoxin subunit
MAKIKVASGGEVGEGRILRIDAAGCPLLLSCIDGRFYAIEAICSHAGGRLEDGEVKNGCIVCPVHEAIFDLATGKADPAMDWASDLQSFRVTVEDGALFVEVPESAHALTASDDAAQSSGTGSGNHCPYAGAVHGLNFDPAAADQRECPFDL